MISYGKCLDEGAPDGAAGGAIGLVHLLREHPVGFGLDLSYVNLGTDGRTYALPGGRKETM